MPATLATAIAVPFFKTVLIKLQIFFIVFAVLVVVGASNAVNLTDGLDGLAIVPVMIAAGVFALIAYLVGHAVFSNYLQIHHIPGSGELAVFCGALIGAALGFLWFNAPPARVFMGDTGSALLGFLAAGFSLWGVQERLFPLWAALLLFSPFIVDASVTLLRRAVRGEPFWQAHRMHYYQRLVRLGWGHRKTLGWEGVLFVAVTGSTVWALSRDAGTQWAVLAFWMAGYPLLMWLVARLEARSPARSAHR